MITVASRVHAQSRRDVTDAVPPEQWASCERVAAACLERRRGLAWTAMFPSVQVVTLDGRLLGRIHSTGRRRHDAVTRDERRIGTFKTLRGAARALARDAAGR